MRKRKPSLVTPTTHRSAYAHWLQIISILDIIKPPSIEAFKEVYCDYSFILFPYT